MIRLSGLEIRAGEQLLVRDATLSIVEGELVALVGASGSGKTMTARALLGLTSVRPGVTGGSLEVEVDGQVHRPFEQGFDGLYGSTLGYLPQDARGGLDPLWTIGRLVRECLELAGRHGDAEPWLRRAGFLRPGRVARLYPHELSGGMAQRASIACALARGASFLIADEPTTGLDPTVQEAILRELSGLAAAGIGVLLITHDLRVVRRHAHRVLVMHEGVIVEDRPVAELEQLTSPPARALLEATARIAGGTLG